MRKPRSLLRLPGEFRLRFAERQFYGFVFQLTPLDYFSRVVNPACSKW